MMKEHENLRSQGDNVNKQQWARFYRRGGLRARNRSSASSTWSNRLTAARHWARFCRRKDFYGEVLWMDKNTREERAEVMLVFTEFLHWVALEIKAVEGAGLSPGSTIDGYARSVVKLHSMVLVDLSFLNETIKSFCEGRDRLLVDIRGPRIKLKKNGFTHSQMKEWEDLIDEWVHYLGTKNPARREKVFRAAYQTMYAAHWRRSDATMKAGVDWNRFWHLSRANVRWFNPNMTEIVPTTSNLKQLLRSRSGYAQVRSPPGKNDATGEGVTARFPSLLPLQSDSWFCPGLNLLIMEIDDPCRPEERPFVPLFFDPETDKALSTSVFDGFILGILQRAMERFHDKVISMQSLRRFYSLHSFRIGAANALRAVGAPKHLRMMAGRWLSDAFMEYERENIQAMLGIMERAQSVDCQLWSGQPDDLPMFQAERNLASGTIPDLREGDIRVTTRVPRSLSAPGGDNPVEGWLGTSFKIMDPVRSGRCFEDGEPVRRAVFCKIDKLDWSQEKPIKLVFRDANRPERWISVGEWSALEPNLRTQVPGTRRYAVGGGG